MRLKKWNVVLLFSIFIVVYIAPIGIRPLFVPDEPRYAEIPREMIARGDWVSPSFAGVRYFEKPVLGYWVHAASLLLFGENEFAVRFPQTLAAVLTGLFIYFLVFKKGDFKENENWPVLSVVVFWSCFFVYALAVVAVLDSLLSLFLTASIAAFFFACEAEPRSGMEKKWLFLSGAACGFAFLTKGFLAFAVPIVTIVPFMLWQRRFRDIFRMSLVPIGVAVLVSLPWSLAVHFREPDFWRHFFWNEHVRRFFAKNAQHKEPFWYYFAVAPVVFLPWSFLVPAAVKGLWDRTDTQRTAGANLIRYSVCWFAGPFIFFSLSGGKLITYILPCFPPFAILVGSGLFRLRKRRHNRWLQWGIRIPTAIFCLVLLAFIIVQVTGFKDIYLWSGTWKPFLFVLSIGFLILFSGFAMKSGDPLKKMLLLGLSPLLLFVASHFLMPGETIKRKAPGNLLEPMGENIRKKRVIITDEESAGAACWYLKRTDIHIFGGRGELEYGTGFPDARGKWLDEPALDAIIRNHPGDVVVILRSKNIPRIGELLPGSGIKRSTGLKGYTVFEF